MTLTEAIQASDMSNATVSFDGYTAYVQYADNEGYYDLSIQLGGMPPHFEKKLWSSQDVEEEMKNSHCPLPINWQPFMSEDL